MFILPFMSMDILSCKLVIGPGDFLTLRLPGLFLELNLRLMFRSCLLELSPIAFEDWVSRWPAARSSAAPNELRGGRVASSCRTEHERERREKWEGGEGRGGRR